MGSFLAALILCVKRVNLTFAFLASPPRPARRKDQGMANRVTGRKILKRIVASFANEICKLNDKELCLFIKRCRELDQTNCWWFEYDLRFPMQDIACNERKSRRIVKRVLSKRKSTEADNAK
jgi:hypothetical protein